MWFWKKKKKAALIDKIRGAFLDGTLLDKPHLFDEFKKSFPKDPIPYIFLGDAYAIKKDYKSAFKNYREAGRFLEKDFDETKVSIYARLYQHIFESAASYYVYNQQDDVERAISLVKELIDEGHHNGLLFWAMGHYSFAHKDFVSANDWFTQSLKKKEVSSVVVADSYYHRGLSRAKLCSFHEAAKDLFICYKAQEKNSAVSLNASAEDCIVGLESVLLMDHLKNNTNLLN